MQATKKYPQKRHNDSDSDSDVENSKKRQKLKEESDLNNNSEEELSNTISNLMNDSEKALENFSNQIKQLNKWTSTLNRFQSLFETKISEALKKKIENITALQSEEKFLKIQEVFDDLSKISDTQSLKTEQMQLPDSLLILKYEIKKLENVIQEKQKKTNEKKANMQRMVLKLIESIESLIEGIDSEMLLKIKSEETDPLKKLVKLCRVFVPWAEKNLGQEQERVETSQNLIDVLMRQLKSISLEDQFSFKNDKVTTFAKSSKEQTADVLDLSADPMSIDFVNTSNNMQVRK